MKFSIIVPCYNLKPWIRACLDSVLAQSFSDWECIVVDDESTDGSGGILDEYAGRSPRLRVIHQRNAGEGGARNAGLAVAQGEWVFFLDGDDVMAPNAMERLAEVIEKHPNENLIRFSFENFEDGDALPNIDAERASRLKVVEISHQISYDDYFVYVWQFIFRQTMIADMRFERYKRGADRTFIMPVLCFKADSFVATDDVCYFYRKRQGSAMNTRPSVQTLKDELSHRLDVIEVIDRSGKTMPYAGTSWLEDYCVYGYISIAEWEGGYSQGDQQQLVDWFYHELPRICNAKDYSLKGKVYARFYCIFRGRFGRHLVSSILPKVFHKIYVLVNPFALMRSIRWRWSGEICSAHDKARPARNPRPQDPL